MSWLWKGRKKGVAKKVVEQWERSQSSQISNELVRIIPSKVPLLKEIAGSTLGGIISKNITFSPSEPQQVSGDLYMVTDTIMVNVGTNIPLIGKKLSVSINYQLKVDTKTKKVVEAAPDLASLKFNLL